MGRKDGKEHARREIFGEITKKRSLSQECVGYGMNGSSGICIKGIIKDWNLDIME